MPYMLLAADMDDTLLNERGVMTLRTQTALRKLVASGIYFVPATGRALANMGDVIAMFENSAMDLPFILYNGALVVMHNSKEELFSAALDCQDAIEIFKMGVEKNVPVRVCTKDRMYFAKDSEETIAYQKKVNFKVEIVGSRSENNIDELSEQGIIKIVWLDDPAQILAYQDELSEHFSGKVNVHTSVPKQLEFVHTSASKGIALEKIGEHLGLRREDLIAVGDGYNDLSMLKYAGYSVAMGNAPDDIKAVCNHVTFPNTEDGVAVFIEDFLKKRAI
jgi:Cof subfamily protein (haloacid dehalogenase superfamily)